MSEAMTELTQAEQTYFATRGESALPQDDNCGEAGLAPEQDILQDDVSEGGQDKPQGSRMVPHGALHAEREEHKKTRAALQQLRAEAAEMQENLRGLMAADADRMPPDPAQDFVGFTRWQVDELNRLKVQVAESQQRQERQEQAAAMENRLWQEWEQSVAVARNEHADIDEAIKFLSEARDRQLDVLGRVDMRFQNKAMRNGQMQAELREIVVASFQRGQNPAHAIYEIAKAYGYGGGEGQRIARLQNAQAAARTLTATQGREAGDPMLLETVAGLSQTEFTKWYENNKSSFRKMFGG